MLAFTYCTCDFVPTNARAIVPEFRAPRDTIRIGILSKYAPRAIDVYTRDARLFINGQTIVVGASGAGTHPVRVSVALYDSANLRVRISEQPTIDVTADSYILDSPEMYEIQLPDANGRRRYTGRLTVTARNGAILAATTLDLETYVLATARAELGPVLAGLSAASRKNLTEAMQAVVRSYALAYTSRHAGADDFDFDLCDLTHCMHFPGLDDLAVPDAPRLAMVLQAPENARQLAPADFVPAYFHSTCGGRLAGPESYWSPEPAPGSAGVTSHRNDAPRPNLAGIYRVGVDALINDGNDGSGENEALCGASPHFRWQATVHAAQIRKIFVVRNPVRLRAADLLRRDGRVVLISYENELSIPAHEFISRAGRVLGWNVIKSNDFTGDSTGDALRFRGRGLGHGVGLCQWGARELARRGKSAADILKFYYPGATIVALTEAAP